MNQLRILLVLCTGIILWMACTTVSKRKLPKPPVSSALQIVDDNPQKALMRLKGVSDLNLLSVNDKDQYMQYIVVSTQARYMIYEDITGDSLILDAQRYFAKKRNYEMAARASYYAAAYWYESKADDKAIEYWLAAFYFSERAGDELFLAKSAYSLGMSCYDQEQWEDAIIFFQKALTYFDDNLRNERHKYSTINMLGQIYLELKKPEKAYQYFDYGLKAATDMANLKYNSKYESRFLRQIGNKHTNKGEYRQAKECFDLALSNMSEPDDRLRIYLSYAQLYRAMNRPDSAFYYLSMIKNQIPEITYPSTRRDMYAELAWYYQLNKANMNKATHYLQLAQAEDTHIKNSQSWKKIKAMNQPFKQVKLKTQTEGRSFREILDDVIISLLLTVTLLVIVEFYEPSEEEKHREIIKQLLNIQRPDQQNFLLTGLKGIAKSTDDLIERKLADPGSPIWEKMLLLREEFSLRLAECAGEDLKKLHNGKNALSKLAPEDLSIIYLSQQSLPDEEIGWMLGRQDDKEEYIILRKGQIRQMMAEAGMKDEDIRLLLP